MANNNRITSNVLKDLQTDLNKKKEIKVCDGQFTVTMYETVRDSLLDEITADFALILEKLQRQQTKKKVSGKMIMTSMSLQPISVLSILTDLYFPKTNDIGDVIEAFNVYLDKGIVKEVYDNIKKEDQQKIKERMEVFSQQYKGLTETAIKEMVAMQNAEASKKSK